MNNWSLVCFTLFTQSAIGLVWVSVMGRWLAAGPQAEFSIRPMAVALALSGLGVCVALAHMARPRRAPHAICNLTASWLSREVLLVQTFAGSVVLVILLGFVKASSGLAILEAAACLLGGAALFAMTRVYHLRTVPVWNSPATLLEFAGSALLLGGVFGAVLTIFRVTNQPGWNPRLVAASGSILLGLVVKLAAISPALAADRNARDQSWYDFSGGPLVTGRVLAVRMGLNMAGLAMVLAAVSGSGPTRLWSCLSLGCLVIAELLARFRFYKAYRRLGL